MAAILVAFGSIVQAQSTPDTAEQTIQTCLTIDVSVESLSSGLAQLGWQRVANADLTEEHVHNYAARRLSEDMAFGQASAVRWKDTWTRAIKNAEGLRRLVSVEDAMSLQLFFEHTREVGFLEANVNEHASGGQLLCSFVVLPEIAKKSLYPLSQNLLNDDMPPVVQLRPQMFDTLGVKRVLNIRLLQTQKITQMIEADFPYIAYVSTTQSRQK